MILIQFKRKLPRAFSVSILAFVTAGFLGGCIGLKPQSGGLNYHLLDQSAVSESPVAWHHPTRTLRLQRVELADHLDQMSVLYRDRSGAPVPLDGDVWSEALADGIGRVLATQLEAKVSGLAVVPYPFTPEAKAERWRIAFRHFEAWEGRGVLIDVTLHWTDAETAEPWQASLRQIVGDGRYSETSDIIAEMHAALDYLAAEIAKHL